VSASLSIAVLQPPLVLLDAEANRKAIERQVAESVGERAVGLVVLPEIFSGWPAALEDVRAAESRAFVGALARQFSVRVVGGSLGWADAGRRYNVCVVVDRAGREVGSYAKRIPFGREQGLVSPGSAAGVFEVDGIRLGVLICGDLWRPELARELMDRIDVLCVPARSGVAADTHVRYAQMLWRNLALTRAMENGLPVVVADWPQARHELDGKEHFTSGGSSVVDPSARPDVRRLQRTIEGTGAILADIDLEAIASFRDYRRSVGLVPVDGGHGA